MEPDLLSGLDAIAEHLGMTRRQASHLHETGGLPTFKVGRTVFARRSALAKHFATLEEKARAGE